jgi:hypothetical protein
MSRMPKSPNRTDHARKRACIEPVDIPQTFTQLSETSDTAMPNRNDGWCSQARRGDSRSGQNRQLCGELAEAELLLDPGCTVAC